MIRTAILAPIHNSLYARLVAEVLLNEKNIQICGIAVRQHWNLHRLRTEFKRDGSRLLQKIFEKYLIGDRRFSKQGNVNLAALAEASGLAHDSLRDLAADASIPYITVPNHNTPNCQDFLVKADPDVIAFTGGGLIRQELLDIPKKGILNCHTGILPEYRGMDVVEWTAAEKRIQSIGFGASLHFMDHGVDTGPILLHKKIAVEKDDTFRTIRERLEVVMVELMLEGMRKLLDGDITPQKQRIKSGRQYFLMHPRILEHAGCVLRKYT